MIAVNNKQNENFIQSLTNSRFFWIWWWSSKQNIQAEFWKWMASYGLLFSSSHHDRWRYFCKLPTWTLPINKFNPYYIWSVTAVHGKWMPDRKAQTITPNWYSVTDMVKNPKGNGTPCGNSIHVFTHTYEPDVWQTNKHQIHSHNTGHRAEQSKKMLFCYFSEPSKCGMCFVAVVCR